MQRRIRIFSGWFGLCAFIACLAILLLAGSQAASAQSPVGKGALAPSPTTTATPECIQPSEVIASPNEPYFNELYGAGSYPGGDTWAVGMYYRASYGVSFTLIERWNGTQWAQVPSPNPTPGPSGRAINVLRSVAATGPNEAWAVGSGGDGSYPSTLIERWDGTQWNIVPSPNVTGTTSVNYLNGVAAASANDVWAVGSYTSGGIGGSLILHWDGAQWAISDTSFPGALNAVTAISANDVWAVGSIGGNQYGSPISVHWDGTAWTQIAVPLPGTGGNATLSGVSGASSSDVWAVGWYTQWPYQTAALVEHWDGSAWNFVTVGLDTNNTSQLSGISVVSANEAWAVGSYRPGGSLSHARTLTLRYDGAGWTVVPGADITPETFDNTLYAVTAASGQDRHAVGSTGSIHTLTERWDGTSWAVTPSESPGLANNVLYDLAAAAPNDIWAVGSRDMGSGAGWGRTAAVIQHWDGARWSIVPIHNDSQFNEQPTDLRAVAAVAADDVWAAGMYGPGPDYGVYVVHWNGTQWNQVLVPNPDPDFYNDVLGMAAISANDIYIVGYYGIAEHLMIMHYDGSTWSVAQDASLAGPGWLSAVAGTGPNDVWAVGGARHDTAPVSPLVLHYDGTAWISMPVPALLASLSGVAAISPNDAWAVGSYRATETSPTRTLTLHWNGAAWTQVDSPNVPTEGIDTSLNAVSATGPNDVWAVGDAGNNPNAFTWVLHWDGAAWSVVSSQNPGAIRNYVTSVEATGPGDVWFVGSHFGYTPQQTMVQHIGRFSDVHPADYFSTAVNWLVSRGAISGYSDCSFRPGANTTRGQLSKIVVLAEGWPFNTRGGPHFDDVDTADPFYRYIETAYNRGVISGYQNHTFRPSRDITRAQLCKVIVLAQAWPLDTTGGPHFSDVPSTDAFYDYVETAYHRGVISGYADGTFRPGNSATRGQIAKIVYNAVIGDRGSGVGDR